MSLLSRIPGRRLAAIVVSAFVVGGGAWLFSGPDSGSLPAQVGTAPICDPARCGNGYDDPGEQCDDGNQLDGDSCDPLCRIICDNDSDCPSGECSGDICTNLCGNGTVDPPICTAVGGITCPAPNASQVTLVNLPVQVFPNEHLPADVDGDGHMDIVVLNFMGDGTQDSYGFYLPTIDVILGNGDGSFQPRRSVGAFERSSSDGGRGFDVLDVDQDGDMDIVAHKYPDVFLLTNDNLTFTRTVLFPNVAADRVRHADLNGDGDPDLFIAGYGVPYVQGSSRTFVSYGLPGSAFQPHQPMFGDIASTGDTTRFADMDGDGDIDVVGTSQWEDGYTVRMYRNGGGSFAPSVELYRRQANAHTFELILEDMNGDGRPDIVLSSNNNDAIVLTNNGNGGIARTAILPLPFRPYLFDVADPSGDGVPDVVFGLNQGNEGAMRRLWYARGNGDGTFQPSVPFVTWDAPRSTHPYPAGPPYYYDTHIAYASDLESADYNEDGATDLSMPHATYSDSVTVFLFGSVPVTPCVDVPPVITCSQSEECDDGQLLNGTPGYCSLRCTYCGNGQIDTVNGIVEECDEGAQNGQQGSSCSARCIEIIIDPGHTECLNQQCVLELGPGTNECSTDADCTRTEHLGCTGVGACTIIQGPGQDTCGTNTDCCDPADPSCQHDQCDFLGETCGTVPGPGLPQCSASVQCEAFHFSCENFQCAIQPGDGQDTCSTPDECAPVCNNDAVCDASESCVCGDCIDAPRCTQVCDLDNACEQNESCLCGDCADIPLCIPHMACDPVNRACEIILGPGTNTCEVPEHCEGDPVHLECRSMACTPVLGPGFDTCATDNDCCDPADPLCVHSQCNPFTQSCIVVQGPAFDQCEGATCLEFHSVCSSEGQCVSEPGPGTSECLTSLQCDEDLCPNGTLDPGEACDDDNDVNNDACNNQCQRTCTVDSPSCNCDEDLLICIEDCGNGTVELGEACDDGNDVDGDECSNTCQRNCTGASCACGNGVADFGEDCDEGLLNRTTPPSDLTEWYCNALTCTRSVCFDGGDNDNDRLPDAQDAGCWRYDVQAARNRGFSFIGSLLGQTVTLEPLFPEQFLAGKGDEACPPETIDHGSFCALTCVAGEICPGGEPCPQNGVCSLTCGNGLIDFDLGEECDDANLINDDACSNLCRSTCVGQSCPRCGDGTHHPALGEQCDDGNVDDSDACTNNCAIRCDDDADCAGTCNLDLNICIPPTCGDSIVNQEWETCDDGDIDNTNACNNQCQPTCRGDADCESGRCDQAQQVCIPLCGNGFVDSVEQCDDGNMVNNDGCSNLCERSCSDDATCDCDEARGVCRALCGNGRLDIDEQCDDGNTVDRDQCSNSCRIRCRPGSMCPDSQACPLDGLCPPPAACGDGIVNGPDEQCDDGNIVDGDACTPSCTLRCGQNLECPNGLVCLGEECSECSSSAQCDAGFCVDGRCRQALPLCGNGVQEAGEACDDGNADDGDACTVGCLFGLNHACATSAQCQTHLCQGGTCRPCGDAGQCASGLRCSQGNCLSGPLQCGDGVIQAGEACDDANFLEIDQCTTACVKPFGVACDHASQCASTICSAGVCAPCRTDSECASGLRCAIGLCLSDAQMSMLPNVCGNGVLEGGEECDDGNATYGDGCTPACTVGDVPLRAEVGANTVIQLPFVSSGGLHAAGDGLSDTGPATVAVMAAGAAAGAAWIRRRRMKSKRS